MNLAGVSNARDGYEWWDQGRKVNESGRQGRGASSCWEGLRALTVLQLVVSRAKSKKVTCDSVPLLNDFCWQGYEKTFRGGALDGHIVTARLVSTLPGLSTLLVAPRTIERIVKHDDTGCASIFLVTMMRMFIHKDDGVYSRRTG